LGATKKLQQVRRKREKRVRGKIFGTEEKPRLTVFRSARHIYVQAIADDVGRTLAAASTLHKDLKGSLQGLKKVDVARQVGKSIGTQLMAKNVTSAVFDRGKYLYHGRVKALAEGAREAGLEF